MAVKLNVGKSQPLDKLVREAAEERLDDALALLRGNLAGAREQDHAVHEVRKRLKEVRALARLVRQGLGEKTFEKINTTLRDAGRPLSEVRDATAVIDALGKLDARGVAAVHAELVERRTELRRRIIDSDDALAAAEKAIRKVRDGVGTWRIDGGWDTIEAGIGGAYRKGRRAMEQAFDDADDERWHEWRKRVKDLRYQLEMLAPLWPKVLKAAAKEAHTLTSLLGDDHDLAVLASLAPLPALEEAIAERRGGLRAEARGLGRKLFAEKPGAFVRRLHAYWRQPGAADEAPA
jgi:CHAD domain-containing protein